MPALRAAMGRQKIEIKKIQNEDVRLISFSKRRAGLFSKASCLATLCGVDVAAVVFSPAGTPYSFGSPRVEQIVGRFLSGGKAPAEPVFFRQNHSAAVQELSRQCMELESQVEAAQAKRRALEGRMKAAAPAVNDDPEGMGMEELKKLMKTLDQLKEMTGASIKELVMSGGDGAAFPDLEKIQAPSQADAAPNGMMIGIGEYGIGSAYQK